MIMLGIKINELRFKNVTKTSYLCLIDVLINATHLSSEKAAGAVNSRSTPSLRCAHHPLSGTSALAVTGSLQATWPSD